MRKAIQLSPTTLVLSLPKKWTTANQVQKGTELSVEEDGTSLHVRASGSLAKKKISLSIKNKQKRLPWYLVFAAYVKGYQEIELTTDGKTQLDVVENFAKYFPGFIVDSIKGNKVTLQDMSAQTIHSEQLLEKMFHMVVSLAIEHDEGVRKDILKKKDYTINGYAALGLRMAEKQKECQIYALFQSIERIGDAICESSEKNIAENVKYVQSAYLNFSLQTYEKLIQRKIIDSNLRSALFDCVELLLQINIVKLSEPM